MDSDEVNRKIKDSDLGIEEISPILRSFFISISIFESE